MTIHLSNDARDVATNSILSLVDAGSGPGVLQIRSGTQPPTANDAETGTLLANVILNDPAFSASGIVVRGRATANDIVQVTPIANGTATWFRIKDSAGATVFDGSVSGLAGSGDLKLKNDVVSTSVPIGILILRYTTPV